MPIAENLQDYLSDPSLLLPEQLTSEQAVIEVLRILADPKRDGGATYSLYFGDQSQEPFFVVAIDNRLTQRLNHPDNLAEDMRQFLERNSTLLANPRCCIGIWSGVNPDGKTIVFLDITVLVYNADVAYLFGVENNQIAIFDLQRGIELDTGGTGLPVSNGPSPQEWLQRLATLDRVVGTAGADHDSGLTD